MKSILVLDYLCKKSNGYGSFGQISSLREQIDTSYKRSLCTVAMATDMIVQQRKKILACCFKVPFPLIFALHVA